MGDHLLENHRVHSHPFLPWLLVLPACVIMTKAVYHAL